MHLVPVLRLSLIPSHLRSAPEKQNWRLQNRCYQWVFLQGSNRNRRHFLEL